MKLNAEQLQRYSRHLIMPEVGLAGQEKLCDAKVLLIGAGGLGCPLALYLGAAGVGTLGLVDFDRVDATNLQRQVLFQTADVGRLKVEVARERLLAMNPNLKVNIYPVHLNSQNIMDIIKNYDVVIDGTDNFPTRYLTNDACVLTKKPNIYGSIFRFDGQATVFKPFEGPCYRCLYPEPPPPGEVPSCAEGGVLGILPGQIALIQATEAIKLILGKGSSLIGRLLLFSALEGHQLSEMFIASMTARKPFSNYIQKRIDEGAFRPMNPMLAARAFFGMFSSFLMWQEIFGFKKTQPYDREEVVRTFVSIFLKGMTKDVNSSAVSS